MTHGNSKAHRAPGSIGMAEYPGKVWKGKKMRGRSGKKNVTQECIKVIKIDEVNDLLYVKGPIPGNKGSLVKIRDSFKRKPN